MHTHTAHIIPFPLHRARPSVLHLAQTLADMATTDATLALWDSLPVGDANRITTGDLCDGIPTDPEGRDPLALATMIADFSVLGLFAVQTGQWMRPDLLGDLMALQSRAEGLRIACGGNIAQRA